MTQKYQSYLLATTSLFVLTFSMMGAHAQTATKVNVVAPAPPVLVLGKSKSGIAITNFDVLADLQRANEASRKATLANPESVQRLVSNLLVRRQLAYEAEQNQLQQDPVVAAALQLAKDRVLSDARVAELDAQSTPTEANLLVYAKSQYMAHADKYTRPAQTRARHILIPKTGPESLTKAQELLTQLRAGANFEEKAKTLSTDRSSGERGGDLGYFAAGRMVKPFEEAVNKLEKPGELSEPVESQFGYHIIRLEDRRAPGKMDFDEVKGKLVAEARSTLQNEARQQKIEAMEKEFDFPVEAIGEFSNAQGKP